jgi:hypothetical protein
MSAVVRVQVQHRETVRVTTHNKMHIVIRRRKGFAKHAALAFLIGAKRLNVL